MPIFKPAAGRRWLLVSSVIVVIALAGTWVLFKRGTFETAAGRRWVAIEGTLLILSLFAGWVFFERVFFTGVGRSLVGVVGIVIGVTAVVGSITFFWPPYGGTAPTYPYLYLSTSASEYDRFDLEHPIKLNLIIALPPLDPKRSSVSTVELFPPGTIFVSELTRDGVPIKPVSAGGADFIAYSDPQEAGLYDLEHNEWQTIPFDITPVGNGVWEIDDVSPRGAYSQVFRDSQTGLQKVIEHPDHEVRSFVLDQPGLYTLQLRYSFSGLLGGSRGSQTELSGLEHTPVGDRYVLYGPILSNKVTFRLR